MGILERRFSWRCTFYFKRSYALWPKERPLSSNRFNRYFQRRALIPSVLDWTIRLAEETAKPLDSQKCEEIFAIPLQALAADDRFGSDIVHDGEIAMERLRSGVWSPKSVLAHNDLWLDNVLLRTHRTPSSSESYPFVVIDWAGSKIDGYPFYDLIRFMLSTGVNTATAGIQIRIYSQLLKCESVDAVGYILASLGNLGQHLEAFPEERYVKLVTQCHAFVRNAIR